MFHPHKKILNVVSVYFSVPFFFGNQFLYFKNKGYDIHLICSPSEYLESYATNQQIKYEEINITRTISAKNDLIALVRICNYIKKNKIEVVAGHSPKGALLSMLAAKLMNVPNRIYFRHGLIYTTKKGLSRKILIWEERFVSYCAKTIVCVSPSLAKLSLIDKLNPESKQTILGKGTCGGIDTKKKFNPNIISVDKKIDLYNKLGITPNSFVIGYSGRIVKDKGIIELIDGFEMLKEKYPLKDICLLLVGTFEERDSLPQSTIDKIINDKQIIYTGYVSEDIEYYYSLMSMLILPSYREGFGMCVIEASAMDKPVLTTRSHGCVDSIIEGETGFYVDINSESICKGIEMYFDDELRAKIGMYGRKFVVENYDNLVLWDEIEKLY